MSGAGDRACRVSLSVMSPPGIRRDAGQQVIERAAERVHIALDAGRAAVPGLLGRHVVHGADRRPFSGDALILELGLEGQPQVDDLGLARWACGGCSMA